MRAYHHIILIVTCFTVLCAGLLGTVFHWDFYAMEENRKLAPFPRATALDELPNAFEAYFNDHFGFRNTFIRRHRKLMRKIEKSNQVIFGNDRWLFFNDDTIIKDYLGQKIPDTENLERISAALQSRIDWLKEQNIDYLFLMVPNKITVYPEHLPDQLIRLRGRTNRECLLDYFDGRFDDNMLDLVPTMIRNKPQGILYYRTDTHWNGLGAYLAHVDFINTLRSRHPDVAESLTPDMLETESVAIHGDLARMSGVPEKYPMQDERFRYPDKASWTTNVLTNAVFLTKENLPLINEPPYTVHNPSGRYSVLVFHDSFMEGFQEFLPYYFADTTYIWRYSNPGLLQAAVELCRPDIVIEEVVERFLVDNRNGALLEEMNTEMESTAHGL